MYIATPNTPTDRQDLRDTFAWTTVAVVSRTEFECLLDAGRRLRIEDGVDVTTPHLHIEHIVNRWMMRPPQDIGHLALIVIGDFSTRNCDPTGRSRTRAIGPAAEIADNAGSGEACDDE